MKTIQLDSNKIDEIAEKMIKCFSQAMRLNKKKIEIKYPAFVS